MAVSEEGEVIIGCVAAMMLMAAIDPEGSISKKHKLIGVAATMMKGFATKPSEFLNGLEELSFDFAKAESDSQYAFFVRYSGYPTASKLLLLDAAGMIGVIGGDFSEAEKDCLIDLANWINVSSEEFSSWRKRFQSIRPEPTEFDIGDLFKTLGFRPSV